MTDLSLIRPEGTRWRVTCLECGWRGIVSIPMGEAEAWLGKRITCPSGTHMLQVSGIGLNMEMYFGS
jgi:hypothetical protein